VRLTCIRTSCYGTSPQEGLCNVSSVGHREALSFVVLSADHKTTLYSVDAKVCLRTPFTPVASCLLFSGLRLGSLNADGHVYIWHCPTGTLLEVLPGHQKNGVNSAEWCPTAVMFATCGDDGTVRIWEPEPATTFEEMLRDGTQVGSPVTIEPGHEVALSR